MKALLRRRGFSRRKTDGEIETRILDGYAKAELDLIRCP